MEKTGWSDSILNTKKSKIHFYKNGVSLCGFSVVNNGNRYFDLSDKNETDVFSGFCKVCIKKAAKG